MKRSKPLRYQSRSTGRSLEVIPRLKQITPLMIMLAVVLAVLHGHRIPVIGASEPDDGSASYTVFLPIVSYTVAAQAADPIDGSMAECTDFILSIVGIDVDIPDPGWVWVDPAQKFRDVTGVVEKSKITHTDFPANHDSHDQNTDIVVDPGQEDLLSDVNKPNNEDPVSDASELLPPTTIELEWEIGTFPSERGKNAPERFFPRWAWPNVGDRVWANGHWIFDCGHGKDVGGVTHHRTEIHPARAIASMRDQVRVLPGTGATPVPVTATDLYIHGRAGFVVDILNCGMDIIIAADPDFCPTKTTPIDDDFEFDIHLPAKPSPNAVLATFVEDGPGNTIDIAPILEPIPADDPTSIHVTIPLEGSGVGPVDVYARKIYAGWVFPPDPPLRHFRLTLTRMHLHDDNETDPGDCECTFFWMNVDRSHNEWFRLVDFEIPTDRDVGILCPDQDDNVMNDFDGDEGAVCGGNGNLNMSGPTFDFFVRDGQPFSIRANGYDQDCLDDHFGDHRFEISTFLDCYLLAAAELNPGDNDAFPNLEATFGPPDYGVGARVVEAGDLYNLQFTIEEIPLAEGEDSADLRLTKMCKPDETVLAGRTFTCTVWVDNLGPGLPRNVLVEDTLLTNVTSSDYTMGAPTFTFGDGLAGTPAACDVTPPNQFTCELGSVPLGGRAIISVTLTSNEGGDFNNEARVSTDSTDPDLTNNQAVDGLTVIPVSDLAITKSDSPDPVDAGTSLTYTLSITNNGPSTAASVVVDDMLPAGVSIVSVSGSGNASCHFGVPGDPVRPTTCAYGSLAPSATATMTIVVNVDPGVSGVLHNDARVRSDAFDPDNSNNLASQNTTVKVADLEIVKTSDADVYKPSSTVKYTIDVVNNGPANALNVIVTDDLPDIRQAEYVFDTAGCSKSGLTLTCDLGTIAAGGSKSFNVYVRIKGSKGEVTNTASVTSSTADPNTANNSSTRVVLIKGGL